MAEYHFPMAHGNLRTKTKKKTQPFEINFDWVVAFVHRQCVHAQNTRWIKRMRVGDRRANSINHPTLTHDGEVVPN